MKRALVLSVVIVLAITAEVFSQVTINYDVEVTTASGPHAALFPAGERLLLSYTLDPAAVDSEPDPKRGIFPNSVLSMSINYPGISIFANTGPSGSVQTFDNAGTCQISDQVFIHGGPITSASTLGGETINTTEVDFLSKFVVTPQTPFMLSNDSLPLVNLNFDDAFVIFRTVNGNTFVHFHLHPRDRAQRLVNEVGVLEGIGVLTASQASRLRNELEAAISALDRGNTRSGCDNLRDFINRVNDLIDDGVLSPTRGQSFINDARDIRSQIGC